jgi:TonB-linked SusC/RagA family outer membrane protein
MQVLKDASSTAIFGARGANGVVVITTKTGQAGAPHVSFNATFTVDELSGKVDLMKPYEFVRLQSEFLPESSMATSYFSDGRDLEWYRDKEGLDWQDEVYRRAFTQNYAVSLRGGSPSDAKNRTLYNISLSALDQNGILLRSKFQRYQGRVNFTQHFGKKVSFNVNVNYTRSTTGGITPTTPNAGSSQSGWLIYSVWGYRPISSKTDGSVDLIGDITDFETAGSNDYRFNPVYSTKNEHLRNYVDLMTASSYLNYNIIKGLSFKLSGSYTMNKRRREEFNNTLTYTGYPGSSSGKGINGGIYWYDTESWQSEAQLSYDLKRGKHIFKALLGGTLQGSKYTYDGTAATHIKTDRLSLGALYTGDLQPVEAVYHNWRQMSAFGRMEYNYDYKYYIIATFRADGSSKFPSQNWVGWHPSVGVSWNFSREDFLAGSQILSNGKLRASWGVTGNNRTSTPYDFLPRITTTPGTSASFDYVFNGTIIPGYYVDRMANDKLRWEITTQWNVGIDLGFLRDRIRLTADLYLKNTGRLLLNATQPPSSGYTSSMINVGMMSNKGLELTLETTNIQKGKFQWTTNFNIAFNRNKILSLVGGQHNLTTGITWETRYNNDYPYVSQVGKSTGLMFGLLYEGTYKYDDFNESGGVYTLKEGIPYHSSVNRPNVQPGDPKYADMNGDGIVSEADRTIIGRGQPIHTGGFGNTFTYGRFDLNVFMTWSWGNDILNANRLVFEGGVSSGTNHLASYSGRWSPENPESDIPRTSSNAVTYYSSRVIEDGSFLRLNNLSLGYSLPERAVRKLGMKLIRFQISLNNIHTFTNYSGPDPEVSTRNSVLTPGFDWSAYPRTFGFTGGINLEF